MNWQLAQKLETAPNCVQAVTLVSGGLSHDSNTLQADGACLASHTLGSIVPAPHSLKFGAIHATAAIPVTEPPLQAASTEGAITFLEEFAADTTQRVWLNRIPDIFRQDAMRPYTAAEIAAAAAKCNTQAAAPEGRKPKLILQLGAAGTGKSSRLRDACEFMSVDAAAIVEADGDNIRTSHQVCEPGYGVCQPCHRSLDCSSWLGICYREQVIERKAETERQGDIQFEADSESEDSEAHIRK